MIRSIAYAAFAATFAMAVTTSAQAMPVAPVHKPHAITPHKSPSRADRAGHASTVFAYPESPSAKSADVRCGVQDMFAVGGIEHH